MMDTSIPEMPVALPQTKPAQVSTELPKPDEEVTTSTTTVMVPDSTSATSDIIAEEPQHPEVPHKVHTKLQPDETADVPLDESDEILDDDSDDGAPIGDITDAELSTEKSTVLPDTVISEDAADMATTLLSDIEESTTLKAEVVTEEPSSLVTLITTTVAALFGSNTCTFDGVTYQDKDEITTANPCDVCFCDQGDLVCALRECPKPVGKENCTPLPVPEGECCAAEYSCGKYPMWVVR